MSETPRLGGWAGGMANSMANSSLVGYNPVQSYAHDVTASPAHAPALRDSIVASSYCQLSDSGAPPPHECSRVFLAQAAHVVVSKQQISSVCVVPCAGERSAVTDQTQSPIRCACALPARLCFCFVYCRLSPTLGGVVITSASSISGILSRKHA